MIDRPFCLFSAPEDSRAVLPVPLGFHHAGLCLVQFRCVAVGCSQQPGKALLISQGCLCWSCLAGGLCMCWLEQWLYLLCALTGGVKSC